MLRRSVLSSDPTREKPFHHTSQPVCDSVAICLDQHKTLYRHDVALEHAQSAIFHAQELVRCEMHEEKTQSGGDVLDEKSQQEKIGALAIAYHNLAVEL